MRGRPAAVTAGTTRPTAKIFPPIKVLFPSLRTVLNSTRGPPVSQTKADASTLIRALRLGRGDHVLHGEALESENEGALL